MSAKLPVAGEHNHRTKGLVRLTMACNERCPFCNVPVEDYERPTPPLADVMAELDVFVDSGQRGVTISGGEPTLYRDRLLALIRRARQGGIDWVELQTNAVLIDDGYAAALADAGLTGGFVSLLSHEPALHDQLAGLDGAFADCMRGIRALTGHGVHVVLNPVIATQTQQLIAEYVDFVAAELPAVEGISLSAVQPHGRAARNLDLLPDYAVLADEVPRARRRADHHGVRLLNPYCGLPLCVGWADHSERSVEANEAAARRRGISDAGAPPGLDNAGNKAHGAACFDCALRSRCGGAWHAYWDHRGGSGIAPPARVAPPWRTGGQASSHQTIVDAGSVVDAAVLARVTAATTPTVWVRVHDLALGDAEALWRAGATELCVSCDANALTTASPLTRELRALARINAQRPAQDVLRVSALVDLAPSFRETFQGLRTAAALGVVRVGLRAPSSPALSRFLTALPEQLPGLTVELA